MKALCVTCCLTLAWAAAANGNEVQWSLTGPSVVTAGQPAAWQASVTVTGDNQGLAGYAFTIAVGPAPGPSAGPDGEWGTGDDENVANVVLPSATWANSFLTGGAGPASVKDGGAAGGPGMSVLASAGTGTLHKGELIQVGASHLAWAPFPGGGPDGQTAGVGRADRKGILLADPAGEYVLNTGTIPTAGLPPSDYVVVLVPLRARVLRPDLSFAASQPGFIMMAAPASGASFSFTIPAYVPPDFDEDGYVDAQDLEHFSDCYTGPAVSQNLPACLSADFDGDGDVDQSDFGLFQGCYSGELTAADPACMN